MNTQTIQPTSSQQFYLSASMVDSKDNLVKIINSSGKTATVISPTPYSINNQLTAQLGNGQYVTLKLVQKLFTVVDGYFLTVVSLAKNTIPVANVVGVGVPYSKVFDLIKGNNAINHDLGFTPRQVSFQQAGAPVGLGYNVDFYNSPTKIMNVKSNEALSQVTVNIVAY